MGKALGVWSRLGIVITAFWMVGGSLYLAADQMRIDREVMATTRDMCIKRNIRFPKLEKESCEEEYYADISRESADRWRILWDASKVAGLIASIAWVFIGILYISARWVLAGRSVDRSYLSRAS